MRALGAREHRERTGLYTIEGVRFLVAAADAGAPIAGLVVCKRLLRSTTGQMIVRRLRKNGVAALAVPESEFATISRLREGSGRGVVAIVRQRWSPSPRIRDEDLWLAVEPVRSPGNLGSLLRTCLAVGVRGVFALGDVDLHDPGCVRATMGALHALELARASCRQLVELARRSGAVIVGASPDGTRDFRSWRYRAPTVLLVGSERRGISPDLRDACDALVRIPMFGPVDSLNLAVAGSLVLYQAFTQRHPGRKPPG